MRRKLKNNEIRKIYKHGNSLGVTLPREILDEFKWPPYAEASEWQAERTKTGIKKTRPGDIDQ